MLRATFTGIGWVKNRGRSRSRIRTPQTDAAVYRGQLLDYTDHSPAADTLLVVEVADTSLFYDTTTKTELYAEQGIAEYWVADVTEATGKKLLVFRDPAPIPAGGHHYRTTLTRSAGDTVTPVNAPAHVLRVADLLP